MNILLLGATGFIGQALCDEILSRGWSLTVMVRNPESHSSKKLEEKPLSMIKGDILNLPDLESVMNGYDVVIHNAGYYEFGITGEAKEKMEAINVRGTSNVMEAASKNKVPRLIYISSTLAYGATDELPVDETYQRKYPFRSFYEETKAKAHEIALGWIARGLPVVIVCPDGVMDVNDYSVWGYLLRMYLNGLLPFSWGPHFRQSHVFRVDLVKGIALAAEKGRVGETYLLAGEAILRRDLIALWSRYSGRRMIKLWVSEKVAMLLLSPMAGLFRMMDMPAVLSRELVNIGSCYLNFSSRKAQQELGWSFTPAEEMWKHIVTHEMAFQKKRKTLNPLKRIKPLTE